MKTNETVQRIIGDDWDFILDVRVDGKNVGDLTGGGAITPVIHAAVQDKNGNEIIASQSQADSLPGADWTNGIVAVELARALTAGITAGFYYLELQIESGGRRRTWLDTRIRAVVGVIS